MVKPEISAPPKPATDNEKLVAEANNQFAFSLYSNLSRNPEYADKNIFFSPFGLSTSMAVIYEGAGGNTANEIQSVFRFPEKDTLRQGYKDFLSDPSKDSKGDVFLVANGLWAEKSYLFLPGYIQNAQQYYFTKVSKVDFINNSEESRQIINRWAQENTKDQIRELFPQGKITPITRLVSTNAMYFSGSWEQPFDKRLTRDENFFTGKNESVRVRMMRVNSISHYKFNYIATVNATENAQIEWEMMMNREDWSQRINSSDENFQMIELPYKHISGKELSMLVVLPFGKNLTAFENSFTLEKLVENKKRLKSTDIHVSMPKFRFETAYDLPNSLKTMGMPTAFSSFADFSGMDGTRTLFLSDVMHKAFIDVNEEGTIAAAVTGSGVSQGIDPFFNANHPFLFIIQDRDTGAILFMGRVKNPNE